MAKKTSKKRKFREMVVDDWDEEFKPITNYHGDSGKEGQEYYETFGKEYEVVKKAFKKNPLTVWTRLDSGVIINGFHWVNRLSYYITKVPAARDTDYQINFYPIT